MEDCQNLQPLHPNRKAFQSYNEMVYRLLYRLTLPNNPNGGDFSFDGLSGCPRLYDDKEPCVFRAFRGTLLMATNKCWDYLLSYVQGEHHSWQIRAHVQNGGHGGFCQRAKYVDVVPRG